MASRGVRIQFLAFERSLRAVGCDLPLLVIPYNDELFDLPPNAKWWEKAEFTSWLKKSQAHPTMAKYVCLTEANYAYFDTDICFIEDCRPTLAQQTGFVVADTELMKYGETATSESVEMLARKTSLWQLRLFNTGHFASDTPLYSLTELESTCAKYSKTCLLSPHHEQPGINLLALVSGVAVTNLCLPPHNMESTMAVDYERRTDWENVWKKGRRPYFIHYAGGRADSDFPISKIFFDYLTEAERKEWMAAEEKANKASLHLQTWPLHVRILNRLLKIFDSRFYVQPKPYDVLRDEAVGR
ncbi:MAG TPA: hypothetical protein VFS35_01385 [Terrimicrobiaceae bacterium]|nr:hypothetical protein [Terrimicrobiaceae bacterium]